MSTSRDLIPTREEEELSDEQILADIRRSLESPKIPANIDTDALALGALEQYWADRAKGAIDEKGEWVDDIALSFRLASRKLAELQGATILENVLLIVPFLAVAVLFVFFPSLLDPVAKVFRDETAVRVVCVLAVLLCLTAFASKRSRETWVRTGQKGLRYAMPALAGVLLATLWVAFVGLQRHQQQEELRALALRHEQEFKARTERQEQELKALWVAEDSILKFSLAKIESGSFENTSRETQTLPMSGKRPLRLTPSKISSDRLEYKAVAEGLPAPIEIKINKNSGALSVLKEDGRSETTSEFFVGTVAQVTDNKLTLTIKDEQGKEKSLTVALNSMVTKPTPGQKIFVAVNSKNNTATEVVEFKADRKLPTENQNNAPEHSAPGP